MATQLADIRNEPGLLDDTAAACGAAGRLLDPMSL
jgi:hypothetical protein